MGSLLSGSIRQKENVDTLGTSIQKNMDGKALLLYDTEQSEVQLYKNISGILKRAKIESMPDYFKAYCLTGMSRKERIAFCRQLFQTEAVIVAQVSAIQKSHIRKRAIDFYMPFTDIL